MVGIAIPTHQLMCCGWMLCHCSPSQADLPHPHPTLSPHLNICAETGGLLLGAAIVGLASLQLLDLTPTSLSLPFPSPQHALV